MPFSSLQHCRLGGGQVQVAVRTSFSADAASSSCIVGFLFGCTELQDIECIGIISGKLLLQH